MLHGLTQPGVAGSELTRILALWAPARTAGDRPAFAESVGDWLGWAGAIALSSALQTGTASGTNKLPHQDRSQHPGRAEADYQRVRAALLAAIAAGPRDPASSPTDFGPYRRHCAAVQQAMQDAVGALRQRLRLALAQRSPALARLAAVDAALDQALAQREHSLLGTVPLRLQARFEALLKLQTQVQIQNDPGVDSVLTAPPGFAADFQRVLQAELAHRLLPAQGLLEALQTPALAASQRKASTRITTTAP